MKRILTIAAITAVAAGYVYWGYSILTVPYYKLMIFDAEKGRRIIIWTKSNWEDGRSLLYEVKVGGRTLVPRTVFYSVAPGRKEPDFGMIVGKSLEVVGIFERWRPEKMLIIHDFSSGQSYPREGDAEGGPEAIRRRDALFRKLQDDYPGVKLEPPD